MCGNKEDEDGSGVQMAVIDTDSVNTYKAQEFSVFPAECNTCATHCKTIRRYDSFLYIHNRH